MHDRTRQAKSESKVNVGIGPEALTSIGSKLVLALSQYYKKLRGRRFERSYI